MSSSNFNHLILSQQAAFGSCTTSILADGAVTLSKMGTLASVTIQDITYTAATGGNVGNNVSIAYIESTLPGQETVVVSGNTITVNIGNSIINITDVLDSTHFLLASTADIQVGDTITQGIQSTTVVSVVSSVELQVVSTTGFVTGNANDNGLLSTATQVLTAIQNSYLASTLVTAVITGTPSNKQIGVSATFLSGGSSHAVVSSLHADSSPKITGDIQFVSGSNISLSQVGNAITVNSSATTGVSSVNSLTGAIILAAGTNISIVPSGNTLTINNTATSAVWGNITGTITNQSDLQTEFATKQNTLTFGSISTSTSGVSVTNGSNSTVGPNVTIAIATASGSQNGLLSSTDWTTFNNKQPAGSYITALTGDVTASGPGSATATLSASAAVKSLHADSSVNLTGNVQLVSGTNVTLNQVGQAITINSSGGLSTSNFVFGEDLTSQINGITNVFILANIPTSSTDSIFLNGNRLRKGASNDYTIVGDTITLSFTPVIGDNMLADYLK